MSQAVAAVKDQEGNIPPVGLYLNKDGTVTAEEFVGFAAAQEAEKAEPESFKTEDVINLTHKIHIV